MLIHKGRKNLDPWSVTTLGDWEILYYSKKPSSAEYSLLEQSSRKFILQASGMFYLRLC